MVHRMAAVVTVFAVVAASNFAVAGKYNKKIDIGDKAPTWSSIPGCDGEEHSFADYKGAKALVICFTCNKCPVAVAYEGRMKEIAKDYADKGVKFVAINVNRSEDLDAVKKRSQEKDFEFSYLYDETEKSAKAYGATRTPEFFVLCPEGTIAYTGALDDNMKESKVKEKYLRNAIDAVLAGNEPETAETKPVGCGIKWR